MSERSVKALNRARPAGPPQKTTNSQKLWCSCREWANGDPRTQDSNLSIQPGDQGQGPAANRAGDLALGCRNKEVQSFMGMSI